MKKNFTPREAEILAHRARGFSVKEISSHLGLSISTVKTHLVRIFDKLEVHSSLELLCWLRDQQCRRCPHHRWKGKDDGVRTLEDLKNERGMLWPVGKVEG